MLTMMILTSMMITLASAMTLSMNPLSMGIIILMTSLILTLVYSTMMTSWIAFLIFLIYIGGMLVMFAYFVALTPNQQMNLMTLIPLMMLFTVTFMYMTMSKMSPTMSTLNMKYMYTFYLTNNVPLLLILALILLFTMIVVVKLVTNNKGPLRPFMNYV
uniref:NADH dehydrogenase subunit 6 n=1 Tax=Enchytraeus irregularis TaxID=2867162 RepID=UPI0022FD811D|nr:NADH dehydrogenase subunit 6 [Enchytraeus irregularis]WAS35294.1 NADH dehydrogenase subunit 6 [Enchytraeus irregularis]